MNQIRTSSEGLPFDGQITYFNFPSFLTATFVNCSDSKLDVTHYFRFQLAVSLLVRPYVDFCASSQCARRIWPFPRESAFQTKPGSMNCDCIEQKSRKFVNFCFVLGCLSILTFMLNPNDLYAGQTLLDCFENCRSSKKGVGTRSVQTTLFQVKLVVKI